MVWHWERRAGTLLVDLLEGMEERRREYRLEGREVGLGQEREEMVGRRAWRDRLERRVAASGEERPRGHWDLRKIFLEVELERRVGEGTVVVEGKGA